MSTNTDIEIGEGVESPEDIAKQAAKQALERVERAGDTTFARLEAESEATHQLIDGLVQAVNNGFSKSRTGAILGTFADETSSTKTELRELLDDALADAGPDASEPPLNEFLAAELDEVVVSRSTDHNQDTRYSWRFTDGYVIETAASGDGSVHYSPERFRKEIFGVMGRLPGEVPETVASNWTEHICSVIDDKKTETVTQGRRTAGVEALGNHIRKSIAYGMLDVAAERDGIYLPGEEAPEEHQGEIWVSNEAVVQICDEKELTTARGLQLELDARDRTSEQVRGASYSTFVNGTYRTYWRLDADFAEPLDYEEEPKTPAEKAAQRLGNDDEADDTTAGSESTETDTANKTDDEGRDDQGGDNRNGDGRSRTPSASTSNNELPTEDSPRRRAINPDLRKSTDDEDDENENEKRSDDTNNGDGRP